MTTFNAWFQKAIVPKVSQQKSSLSNSKWRSSSSTKNGLFQGSKLGGMLYLAHGQVLGQTFYARGHVPMVDFDPCYQNSVLRQHHFLFLFGFQEALHLRNESYSNDLKSNHGQSETQKSASLQRAFLRDIQKIAKEDKFNFINRHTVGGRICFRLLSVQICIR